MRYQFLRDWRVWAAVVAVLILIGFANRDGSEREAVGGQAAPTGQYQTR